MVFMEFELRRSVMSMNASAVLANPIIIYSALGFYGLIIVAVLLYVYRKFSGANLLLESLRKDWESAESNHNKLLKQAKDHVSKLAPAPVSSQAVSPVAPRAVTFDTRNQVIAMGRKGFTATDIS